MMGGPSAFSQSVSAATAAMQQRQEIEAKAAAAAAETKRIAAIPKPVGADADQYRRSKGVSGIGSGIGPGRSGGRSTLLTSPFGTEPLGGRKTVLGA